MPIMQNDKLTACLGLLGSMLALGVAGCNEQRNRSIELMNQGIAKYQNHLLESAETDLLAATQLDPSNILATYNLGKLYEESKRWPQAAEAFGKVISMDATKAEYHYDYGHALQETGKNDLAEKQYQETIQMDPKSYKAAYRLGTLYEKLERNKDADDAYRTAIGANPRFSHALVALGFLYLRNEYVSEAEQVFSQGTKMDAGDGESWYGLGLARKEQRNHDGAIEALEKAQTTGAQSPDLKYNLALAFHAKGDDAKAKTLLQQFISSSGQRAGEQLVRAASDLLYSLP